MKDNRMDNIVECAYNMDNGYVEVWFTDGNMLRIKCEEVEAALRTTEQSLAKLHRLLDNKPIEYVAMALSGEMQAYCDIEDEMVKDSHDILLQQYLELGYSKAMAEVLSGRGYDIVSGGTENHLFLFLQFSLNHLLDKISCFK